MKGFKSIPVKLKGNSTHSYGAVVEPITIKEPYKPDIKEFADTEEFTRYFRGNEDTFKEASDDPEKPAHFLTANKLNRTYKIPGYRIRIIRKGTDNEELTLVKDYYTRATGIDEPLNEVINDTNSERINELATQLTDIIERINNIESFLVQLKRW